MRRPRLAAMAGVGVAALLLGGAGIEPRRRRGGGAEPGPGVIIKRERVPMPAPPARPLPAPPSAGAEPRASSPGGVRIERRSSRPPPELPFSRAPEAMRRIEEQRRVEIVPKKSYWHEHRGRRYAHYHDGLGSHWYGFHHGGAFHWTRWHAGHWWWHDAARARWLFWWNDHWWWPGPSNVMYVYVRGDYSPYRDGAAIVRTPESQPPPAEPPPSPDLGGSWVSPDGRRMVQVMGPQGDAFLYDRSGAHAVFMKFLAKDVERVRFSEDAVMLDFRDGRFALFDRDGNPR